MSPCDSGALSAQPEALIALPRAFYARPVLIVARALLGMRLVRWLDGARLVGVITETEAYDGEGDLACHARSGITRRNAVMYGEPGRAYIYFTYGMHWCLNAVAEREGYAAAVLLRAVQPVEGIEIIAARRKPQPANLWTNGPARLTLAFGIDGSLNGCDLCDPQGSLYIAQGTPPPAEIVKATPRIGIQNVPEPWRSQPWRFVV